MHGQIQQDKDDDDSDDMEDLIKLQSFWSSLKKIGGNALKVALSGALGGGQIQGDDIPPPAAPLADIALMQALFMITGMQRDA